MIYAIESGEKVKKKKKEQEDRQTLCSMQNFKGSFNPLAFL